MVTYLEGTEFWLIFKVRWSRRRDPMPYLGVIYYPSLELAEGNGSGAGGCLEKGGCGSVATIVGLENWSLCDSVVL